MKVSKKAWAASIAWAALISAATRGEPEAAWLAVWTIALAPLALTLLAAALPRPAGRTSATDAEALAWEQPWPPSPPRARGKPIPLEAALPVWRAQPLSA